jgi:predicted SnoaL-like aldol condensation-catalyzing enzyme
MKQLVFVATAAICCCLFSCQNAGNNNMGSPDGEKNKMAVREIYKAIETGDVSKLSGIIADDAVDHLGMNGHEVRGGENIIKMLADMHNHMKDVKMEVLSEAVDGDLVFTWNRMTGTCTDSSMGMRAGMQMDFKSVDVSKFKDGKAIEHWGYMDPADMMKMMPPPPPPMNGMHPMDSMGKK